jgi:hypothetical protein
MKVKKVSQNRLIRLVALGLLVAGTTLACAPTSPGPGGVISTVYRSLVPYTGLGGTAELIGTGTLSRVPAGSTTAVAPVRNAAGEIVGVTAGCLSGASDGGGTLSICFDGPTPGADFVFGTGGSVVVTSQASAGAPVIVDTTSEPAPVPTSGLSTYSWQTYAHTTCTTNAPSFPDGNCYGVSLTLQFASSPLL